MMAIEVKRPKLDENAENVFLGFANHILREILSYLEIKDRIRVEKVCKHLRNISIDTPLWSLNLPKLFDWKNESLFEEFWKRWGNNLRILKLDYSKFVKPESVLKQIRDNFLPKIVRLKFEPRSSSPYDSLSVLGPSLRFLSLLIPNHPIPTGALKEFIKSCRNLESFAIYRSRNFYFDFDERFDFDDLLDRLPDSIRAISIHQKDIKLTNETLLRFPALKQLRLVLPLEEKLESLEIRQLSLQELHIYSALRTRTLLEEIFAADSLLAKSLEILRISINLYPSITAIGNLSHLKDLHLISSIQRSFSSRISPHERHRILDKFTNEMDIVLRHCSQLRILNLSYNEINDCCLEIIGQHCKQLEKLDISNCKYITQDGIARMLDSLLESGVSGDKLTIFAEDRDIEMKNNWSPRLEIVRGRLFRKYFYEW